MERGREGTGGELVSDRQTMRDSLRWSRTVETTQQEDQSKTQLILILFSKWPGELIALRITDTC